MNSRSKAKKPPLTQPSARVGFSLNSLTTAVAGSTFISP